MQPFQALFLALTLPVNGMASDRQEVRILLSSGLTSLEVPDITLRLGATVKDAEVRWRCRRILKDRHNARLHRTLSGLDFGMGCWPDIDRLPEAFRPPSGVAKSRYDARCKHYDFRPGDNNTAPYYDSCRRATGLLIRDLAEIGWTREQILSLLRAMVERENLYEKKTILFAPAKTWNNNGLIPRTP